ncbi:NADP-dependent 3-hydroxy acid dehydrogenase YdfG [Sinorhizobium medicae]
MDKVILITGASSGIGEGIARELGAAGARLLLGARRLDRIEAIAEDRAGSGNLNSGDKWNFCLTLA